jgi:hypothetical protein
MVPKVDRADRIKDILAQAAVGDDAAGDEGLAAEAEGFPSAEIASEVEGKRGPGRPTKFTVRRKKAFLQLLAMGNTIASICEGLDIAHDTYHNARKADPEFALLVDEIKGIRHELVEDSLYQSALAGNVTAQIFYLCNREPEKWKSVNRQYVDVTSGGQPLPAFREIIIEKAVLVGASGPPLSEVAEVGSVSGHLAGPIG